MSDAPAISAGSFMLDLLFQGLGQVWALFAGQGGRGHLSRRHNLSLHRSVVDDLPAVAEDPSACEFSERGERTGNAVFHRPGEQLAPPTRSARPGPRVSLLDSCVESALRLLPGSAGGAMKEHVA